MSQDMTRPRQRGPFPEGTLVRLRTGGPYLMVEDIRSDGIVAVCWFDRDHRLWRDAFHPAALMQAP